jgi:hypothetical protein
MTKRRPFKKMAASKLVISKVGINKIQGGGGDSIEGINKATRPEHEASAL